MKTKGVVILITLLLIVSCVNAQEQEISRLKTRTITLSQRVSKDKTGPPRFWILVESEGRQLKPVEFKNPRAIDDKSSPAINGIVDVSSATAVGQVQEINTGRRRYSIAYRGFSKAADDLWLQVEASPASGMGLLKDMGQMKWEEVDRMPALVLQPITNGISFSIIGGVRVIGPEGLIVRALAGHVYAVHIKDDRTDYRVIFRIDSIDSNGDCSIRWKRIPSK